MADDYSINAKITADASGYESGVRKAQKASQNLSKSISGVIQGLGKSGLVGALGAVGLATGGVTAVLGIAKKAFQQVSKTVKECTESYRKQYKAEIALETAVKNSPYFDGSAVKRLKAYASEIQSFSNLGDEEVLPMMSKLIASGRKEAEVMDIIRVATDMSADGTISFETAVNQLNMTLNGNIGRLGMQNAELKELSEEELKAGKAVQILGDKYKGLAKATADSSIQLKNSIGDFKELMGQSFEKTLAPMRRYFTEVITNLNTAISKAREQKEAFADVYAEDGFNLNADTENMKTVMVELQKQYEEAYRNFQQYVRLYGEYIDKNIDATYLAYQRDIKDYEAQIRELTARIENKKKEAEAEAKRQQDYQNSVEMESKIAKLKADHLEAIQKQKKEWENIELVTGKQVSLEEKLKFYQDDLVKILSESGGYITTSNQYYKDQIKIINDLKKALGQVADVAEEVAESNGEAIEVWADFFSDFDRGFTEVLKNANDGLYDIEKTMSEFKNNITNKVFDTLNNTLAETFTNLGENLVGAGNGFEDFASIALKALSEVLASLGAQLSALAVLKAVTYDYANAAIALAGATSAFVASGVASGVASSLSKTKTQIDAIGDSANKAGKDLEYFKKRLEEITSGMTSSSRNLVANITELKQGWREAKETANEAYEAYDKARKELENDEYYQRYLKIARQTGNYNIVKFMTKPVEELGKKYQELNDEVNVYYQEYRKASKNVLSDIKAEVAGNETLIQSYKDIYQSLQQYELARFKWNLMTSKQKESDKTDYILRSALGGDVTKTLYGQLEEYQTYVNILLNEQKVSVQKLLTDVYDQLSNTGKNIGDKLVNSIINGAEKADFIGEMKSYIRENLVKIAVYTESFQDKLAEVGMKLASALTGSFDMGAVRTELEGLYETASENAKRAEAIIELTFGDVQKKIENEVSTTVNNVKIEINAIGEEIGNTIFSSILEGAERSDFLVEMKNFMRENLLKLAVYTDGFNKQLKEIGERISNALIGDMTEDVVSGLRTEIETLYDSAIRNAERAEKLVNSVFGDIQETVEETTETIEESIEVVEETLTSFEELMKSFNEEVADVGGDIGSTFVDAISNGMNQSDFLGKMKDWIKRMLVQSVVYTESMKSEIEAIGQAITKGIREGFTETSLHEIRRDLSWVFNEANKTVSSLDDILDKTFGGYAIGTNNAMSGLHLVGEAGPELVKFRGGEQVLNANNTQKALSGMSGTTINQNVTFNNLQDTTAYAMMNQFKQYNRQMAINGVI